MLKILTGFFIGVLAFANSALISAQATNLVVNGDFETQSLSANGNNYVAVQSWNSIGSLNHVRVDGPGGVVHYGSSGPESDASAAGGGNFQHYVDGRGGAVYLWQIITALTSGPAQVSASFSNRDNNSNTQRVEMSVTQWAFQTPPLLRSTHDNNNTSLSIPGGNSRNYTWQVLSMQKQLIAGQRYVVMVKIPNPTNVDNIKVEQLIPDLTSASVTKTCNAPVAGVRNGVLGQFINCQIVVSVSDASFNGTLSVSDLLTQNGGTSGQIISATRSTGLPGCSTSTCTLDGGTFPTTKTDSINVQIFSQTVNPRGPFSATNCASGRYDNGNGVTQNIAGNCVTKQWNAVSNVTKTCEKTKKPKSGLYTLNCKLTIAGSNLPTGSYVYLADFFGAYPTGVANVQGTMTNITSSEPWSCIDQNNNTPNSNVGICELSSNALFAAGGTSTVNMTFQFDATNDETKVVNCAMQDYGPISIIERLSKRNAMMSKNKNRLRNKSSGLPDGCVVMELPKEQIDSKIKKECKKPTLGMHNGTVGYFWNCKVRVEISPIPFSGNFTLIEDASNISSGQAQFVSASIPCGGIGSNTLSCVMNGSTTVSPTTIDVQLFTATNGDGGKEIKWQNCAYDKAAKKEKAACQTVSFTPESVSPLKKVDLKKTCQAPFAASHNGHDGVKWKCKVTVTASPTPFFGFVSFIEDASNVSGSNNANIIAINQGNFNCTPANGPVQQTTCSIAGPAFSSTGSETAEFMLFAATIGKPAKPISWQNCASGTFFIKGEKKGIKGNCQKMTWSEKPPKVRNLKITKTQISDCVAGLPCDFRITVTNTGNVAMTVPTIVDQMSPSSGVQVVSPNWCQFIGSNIVCNSSPSITLASGDNYNFNVRLRLPRSNSAQYRNCAKLSWLRFARPVDYFELQMALKKRGFSPGYIDGKMGPATRDALKKFQRANGYRVTGLHFKATSLGLDRPAISDDNAKDDKHCISVNYKPIIIHNPKTSFGGGPIHTKRKSNQHHDRRLTRFHKTHESKLHDRRTTRVRHDRRISRFHEKYKSRQHDRRKTGLSHNRRLSAFHKKYRSEQHDRRLSAFHQKYRSEQHDRRKTGLNHDRRISRFHEKYKSHQHDRRKTGLRHNRRLSAFHKKYRSNQHDRRKTGLNHDRRLSQFHRKYRSEQHDRRKTGLSHNRLKSRMIEIHKRVKSKYHDQRTTRITIPKRPVVRPVRPGAVKKGLQ